MLGSMHRFVLLTSLLAACAPDPGDLPLPVLADGDEADLGSGKADLAAPTDRKWIYNGILPALESPQVVVSLAGHTVRVTGLLPAGWVKPLPRYAVAETAANGRRRLTVVYPIATANTAGGSKNATVGTYPDLRGPVFTPSGIEGNGTPWGGFPYLEYDHGRGIALHGPITWANGRWRLRRGPVSHGCNRMQGEHVVELAHLLGKDMTRPHDVDDGLDLRAPAGGWVVKVVADFDRVGGKIVDVDYPAWTGFTRPTGPDVVVYPTWSADELTRFVCAYRASRPAGLTHCDDQPAITTNPLRREDLGVVACPAGYAVLAVGRDGGRVCSDGTNVLGPFTRGMVEKCRAFGGGPACDTDRWAQAFALSLRGDGVCPAGASLDYRDTGYCVEGADAFGPFPPAMVERCVAGGGGAPCHKSRWSYAFMRGILHALRGDR
jgi:hypothetical protein